MSEFKPVPHYIYGKLCLDRSKPSLHIIPVSYIHDIKGYYGIEIIQSNSLLDSLYSYCLNHNILLHSNDLQFKPIPFNQTSFLNVTPKFDDISE